MNPSPYMNVRSIFTAEEHQSCLFPDATIYNKSQALAIAGTYVYVALHITKRNILYIDFQRFVF